MVQSIFNLIKLAQIIWERGNWPLIRRSRKQLRHFIFCNNGLIQKPLWQVPCYWLQILKGLDALVWRLETTGFLFPAGFDEEQKRRINSEL